MPFRKGQTKTSGSGRVRGTPNKRTQDFLKILEEQDFCPARALIHNYKLAMKEYERSAEIYDAIMDKRTANDIQTPIEDTAPKYLKLAQDAAKELMQYAHPKRKSIELTDPSGNPLSIVALVAQYAGPDDSGNKPQ